MKAAALVRGVSEDDLPLQHDHWDWEKKKKLASSESRFFGVYCAGHMQGMMKFNITEDKSERWDKLEAGCIIAAGVAPSDKPEKVIVRQSQTRKKRISQVQGAVAKSRTSVLQ